MDDAPTPRQTAPPPPGEAAARQVIPRPLEHRPGGPARWADLPVARRRPIALAAVRAAVASRPDRAPDDGGAAALVQGWIGAQVAGNPSSVLVPLFEEDGDTRVVLTVRSSSLRSHRNEVAFPGGRLDPGEETVHGALREAEEEVGLDAGLVEVVGRLTSMPTVSSNTLMTPVVAVLGGRPASLRPNPGEVERIFDVALSDLVADGVFHEEWWTVPGRAGGEFPVWFFDAGGEIIWGATARILVELLCLALGVGDPFVR